MTAKLTDEEISNMRAACESAAFEIRPLDEDVIRLIDENAELKAENANHQETLSSIRYIARHITRETGDVSRIILWVDDALSGYTETREQTMAELKDKLAAAEKERDELRDEVQCLRHVERERDECAYERDCYEAEVKALRTRRNDDPSLDGTPNAHPAWRRGAVWFHDALVKEADTYDPEYECRITKAAEVVLGRILKKDGE